MDMYIGYKSVVCNNSSNARQVEALRQSARQKLSYIVPCAHMYIHCTCTYIGSCYCTCTYMYNCMHKVPCVYLYLCTWSESIVHLAGSEQIAVDAHTFVYECICMCKSLRTLLGIYSTKLFMHTHTYTCRVHSSDELCSPCFHLLTEQKPLKSTSLGTKISLYTRICQSCRV